MFDIFSNGFWRQAKVFIINLMLEHVLSIIEWHSLQVPCKEISMCLVRNKYKTDRKIEPKPTATFKKKTAIVKLKYYVNKLDTILSKW